MGLHIAFLDSWWHGAAKGSGTAVAIDGLARGLTSLGHRVSYLSVDQHNGNGRGQLVGRLLYNLTIPRQIERGRYDLVVGFDWDGFLYRPTSTLPYVVGLKGILADELRHESGPTRWLMWLQSKLEAINTQHAHTVLTTSRYSRRVGIAAYGLDAKKVATVPEGIDAKSGLVDMSDDPPTILSVARQYRRKNTTTLLDAMARLTLHLPQAQLRVVGDGPELPRLKIQCEQLGLNDHVTFLGAVDDATVQRQYQMASLFCLPSRQEGFGIAFLEAMAAGLPVVAANTAATPEVVRHGQTGLLVSADDPDALADALLHLLRNHSRRVAMGRAGRAAMVHYHWPHVARRFLAATGMGDNNDHGQPTR
jgi:glycosyltransferase involved in cell wall biosynthesis